MIMRTFRSYGGSKGKWRKKRLEEQERLLSDRLVGEPEPMPMPIGGDRSHTGHIGNGHRNSSDKDVDTAEIGTNALGLNLIRTTSHESAVTASTSGGLEKIGEGDESDPNFDTNKERRMSRRLSPSPSLPIL